MPRPKLQWYFLNLLGSENPHDDERAPYSPESEHEKTPGS